MKFATIALVATASAITMRAEVEKKESIECIKIDTTNKIYNNKFCNGNYPNCTG